MPYVQSGADLKRIQRECSVCNHFEFFMDDTNWFGTSSWLCNWSLSDRFYMRWYYPNIQLNAPMVQTYFVRLWYLDDSVQVFFRWILEEMFGGFAEWGLSLQIRIVDLFVKVSGQLYRRQCAF